MCCCWYEKPTKSLEWSGPCRKELGWNWLRNKKSVEGAYGGKLEGYRTFNPGGVRLYKGVPFLSLGKQWEVFGSSCEVWTLNSIWKKTVLWLKSVCRPCEPERILPHHRSEQVPKHQLTAAQNSSQVKKDTLTTVLGEMQRSVTMYVVNPTRGEERSEILANVNDVYARCHSQYLKTNLMQYTHHSACRGHTLQWHVLNTTHFFEVII